MKVINIPILGTVIWDKALDYPKLLKQIVELKSEVAWLKQVHTEREQKDLSLLKNREDTNLELHNKNTELYEDISKIKVNELKLAVALDTRETQLLVGLAVLIMHIFYNLIQLF